MKCPSGYHPCYSSEVHTLPNLPLVPEPSCRFQGDSTLLGLACPPAGSSKEMSLPLTTKSLMSPGEGSWDSYIEN